MVPGVTSVMITRPMLVSRVPMAAHHLIAILKVPVQELER
jgi:hypothetical protein